MLLVVDILVHRSDGGFLLDPIASLLQAEKWVTLDSVLVWHHLVQVDVHEEPERNVEHQSDPSCCN